MPTVIQANPTKAQNYPKPPQKLQNLSSQLTTTTLFYPENSTVTHNDLLLLKKNPHTDA